MNMTPEEASHRRLAAAADMLLGTVTGQLDALGTQYPFLESGVLPSLRTTLHEYKGLRSAADKLLPAWPKVEELPSKARRG